jgi:heme/copper-type cytochrome/quinol oxidase subunit 1
VLPAFGLISDILCRFSTIGLFGRDSMFFAILIIGVLGCFV